MASGRVVKAKDNRKSGAGKSVRRAKFYQPPKSRLARQRLTGWKADFARNLRARGYSAEEVRELVDFAAAE
jgi:hypothetical protein